MFLACTIEGAVKFPSNSINASSDRILDPYKKTDCAILYIQYQGVLNNLFTHLDDLPVLLWMV